DWGFSDLSHFTRRFKQRFGCTPGEWRHRPAAPAH
ncbi:MAG TPA: AraC family transcriptional regulator, partial [Bradyrhizobium sp.]